MVKCLLLVIYTFHFYCYSFCSRRTLSAQWKHWRNHRVSRKHFRKLLTLKAASLWITTMLSDLTNWEGCITSRNTHKSVGSLAMIERWYIVLPTKGMRQNCSYRIAFTARNVIKNFTQRCQYVYSFTLFRCLSSHSLAFLKYIKDPVSLTIKNLIIMLSDQQAGAP